MKLFMGMAIAFYMLCSCGEGYAQSLQNTYQNTQLTPSNLEQEIDHTLDRYLQEVEASSANGREVFRNLQNVQKAFKGYFRAIEQLVFFNYMNQKTIRDVRTQVSLYCLNYNQLIKNESFASSHGELMRYFYRWSSVSENYTKYYQGYFF